MNKEDRKIIKDVLQCRDLEMTLPAYANAYVNRTYEYSLIRLVLNYYTMREIVAEAGTEMADAFLSDTLRRIHGVVKEYLIDGKEDLSEAVLVVDSLRRELTDRMTVLTAYSDALQLYEYVLNRIEYGLTEEKSDVEVSSFAAKVFKYLFQDNDKMVINSKIQMVTGQLPIRMTKSRFFDYLTDTLNIYNGSECSSVDNFVSMLKSSAGLERPNGYDEAYPDIVNVIKLLEDTDYKAIDLKTYQALMEQFSMTSDKLSGFVSNYLLVMEMVNNLYAAILAIPYQMNENDEVTACLSMLKGLYESYETAGEIPESVNDGFMVIEGKQEFLGEELVQFDSALADLVIQRQCIEMLKETGVDELFDALISIEKLLSNSLFMDLEEPEGESETADSSYITKKRDELVSLVTAYFEGHGRELNRAVMAAMFSAMPVLFNSQQEIKDYIEYSLNHCNNDSELMACIKILEELMDEDR